uniref:Uncharacterized protein n=1 Tax=Romanomermis culicivorax TaxID=13658 RepID=A0A915IL90_ROMCU
MDQICAEIYTDISNNNIETLPPSNHRDNNANKVHFDKNFFIRLFIHKNRKNPLMLYNITRVGWQSRGNVMLIYSFQIFRLRINL